MTRGSLQLLLFATAASFLPSSYAAAQALSPAAASANSGGSTSSEVGEVVVTAQKRTEHLKDVPAAITAVDARTLVAQNQLSVDDYYRSIPGLNLLDTGNGFQKLIIRGIGTSQGDTPTVGIYIDDTPVGGSTQVSQSNLLVPDIDPSDLQQIEVLKGPQGTLYGAGSMGGLFKYVTVQPDLDKYSGRIGVDGSYTDGGDAGYAVRGAANLPIVQDVLALQVSASTRQDPGFIHNVADDDKIANNSYVSGGRAALLWKPTADTSVEASLNLLYRVNDGLDREDYNFVAERPIYGDLQESRVPNSDGSLVAVEVYNITAKHDFGWATATSSTSYSSNNYAGELDLSYDFSSIFESILQTPNIGVREVEDLSTGKFSQEFRLESDAGGPLSWLAGVFYTHEHSRFYERFDPMSPSTGGYTQGLPLLLSDDISSNYDEIAGYGDVTYKFTPNLDVQAGVRYSYNSQNDYGLTNGVLAGLSTPMAGFGSSHDSDVTFLLTAEYKFDPNQMVYGRIASGYRPGGPNWTLYGQQEAFKSDSLISYELGDKSYFLDHQLYVEASLFYITWDRIQLEGVDALSDLFITNAGAAISQGAELSGEFRPKQIPGLTASASFMTTDAHLTEAAPPGGIYGPAGSRLPYTPRYTAQVGASYERPVSSRWTGRISGDYSYQGSRIYDFQSSSAIARPVLPAYSVVNLQVGVNNGKYSASLFAKNVGNARGLTSAAPLSLGRSLDNYTVTLIQPLTVGVSLADKF